MPCRQGGAGLLCKIIMIIKNVSSFAGGPDVVPGKKWEQRTFPGPLGWGWGWGWEQGGCRAPTGPAQPPRSKFPRVPCFGLMTTWLQYPVLSFLLLESPTRQIGLRFRNPRPRKQAATSQEILGCMRTKPQSIQSAKRKLG